MKSQLTLSSNEVSELLDTSPEQDRASLVLTRCQAGLSVTTELTIFASLQNVNGAVVRPTLQMWKVGG